MNPFITAEARLLLTIADAWLRHAARHPSDVEAIAHAAQAVAWAIESLDSDHLCGAALCGRKRESSNR